LNRFPISNGNFLLSTIRGEARVGRYLKNIKISVGTHSISSEKDLVVLIPALDLRDPDLGADDIQKIAQ